MHRFPGNMKEQHAAARLWKVICCWLAGVTRHLPIVLFSICGASSPGLAATFTVVNLADSGGGSLRQAVLDANASPGANTVTFADGLTGMIVLTSGEMSITNDLTITGPGAELFAVDGNQQSRIFSISAGATVAIAGLTLTNGLATGAAATGGGAILNSGGTLSLTQVTVVGNRAVGSPGAGANGGGVFSPSGTLNVTASVFSANQAVGGSNSGGGGGAITNRGRMVILNSTFIANEARGGEAGSAFGGAINHNGPSSTISGCTFLGNRAIGGDGGVVVGAQQFEAVGGGLGGAVRNAGVLTVEYSAFTNNQAIGGNGGSAAPTARDYNISFGYGGGLFNFAGTITVQGNTFRGNAAIGGSNATALFGRGHVGDGSGGGFINLGDGTAIVSDCTFDHNEVLGGDNNVGGTSLAGGVGAFIVGWGQGGAITNEGWNRGGGTSLTVSRLTLTHNEAIGGEGNSGNPLAGAGIGGGINAWWSASSVTISDSLFAHNKASGGSGANGQGGAVSAVIGAVVQASGTIIEKNLALGGDNSDGAGGNGFGGGVYVDAASSVALQTTAVTGNHANAGGGTTIDGVGIGGGVYSLGTFSVDDPASIRHNHASTSDDDIY